MCCNKKNAGESSKCLFPLPLPSGLAHASCTRDFGTIGSHGARDHGLVTRCQAPCFLKAQPIQPGPGSAVVRSPELALERDGMKVKAKKNSELPANVKAVVDRIINAPDEQLAEVLRGFKWEYDKVICLFAACLGLLRQCKLK